MTDGPLNSEALSSLLEQATPGITESMKTLSGDPLAIVMIRHLEQFANVLRLINTVHSKVLEPVVADEILRASIVYVHASLEEAIRDIARRRIDLWPSELLDEVPLVPGKRANTKFHFHDLLAFSKKSVGETVYGAVNDWLNATSFTSIAGILKFLKGIGVDVKKVLAENSDLFGADANELMRPASQLIKRRHQIVHSQDYEHGSRVRNSIDTASVMSSVVSVWVLIVIIIVEEVRRQPQWKLALRELLRACRSLTPVFGESGPIFDSFLITITTRNGWPYLNEGQPPDQTTV